MEVFIFSHNSVGYCRTEAVPECRLLPISCLHTFINASRNIMEYRRAGSGRFRLDIHSTKHVVFATFCE